MSEQVSTLILSGAPARRGTVSVTTIPASGEFDNVSNALPENTPCVATAYTSRARVEDRLRARGECAVGVDDVVDDHRCFVFDFVGVDYVVDLCDLLRGVL